ncbi:hypothetical protein CRI94_05705 [Longibacter salinarum]|uniref:Uncharacterized protein n=2 Tax=Longibacter salinarum TaxID=1850348 RepID=A0A2A8D0L4_9BACT|nr:hypothetical protein CRI94_05705 [Longibacter salinarum]
MCLSERRSIKERVLNCLNQNESILLKGSASSFIVQSFGALLALFLQVTLARVLGVESYGTYTYVWAWINIAVLVGTFGFKTASVKFIAQYESLAQSRRLAQYLRFSRRVILLVSVGTGLTVVVSGYILAGSDDELLSSLLVAAILVLILTRVRVAAAELRGLQHVVQALVPEKILYPLCFAGLVLLASWQGIGLDAPAAFGINICASLFVLGVLLQRIRTEMPTALRGVSPRPALAARKKRWIVTARDMLMIGGFNVILFRADVLMIGMLISPTESGLYNVASRIATVLVFVLSSVNAIMAPLASKLYSQKKFDELQRVVDLAARVSFVFSGIVAVAIFLVRFELLGIFGDEFRASASALWPLLVGQVVNSFSGPAIMLLNMTDRQGVSARILGVTAIMNVILNFGFIQMVGFQGAAFATMITMVLWNAVAVYCVRREIDIRSTALPRV